MWCGACGLCCFCLLCCCLVGSVGCVRVAYNGGKCCWEQHDGSLYQLCCEVFSLMCSVDISVCGILLTSAVGCNMTAYNLAYLCHVGCKWDFLSNVVGGHFCGNKTTIVNNASLKAILEFQN